jgi:hypothetical protein
MKLAATSWARSWAREELASWENEGGAISSVPNALHESGNSTLLRKKMTPSNEVNSFPPDAGEGRVDVSHVLSS